MRVLRMRADGAKRSVRDIFQANPAQDRATEAELLARGFASGGFIDRFVRPFYGGIFLNRDLHTSARFFQFVCKMLAEGDTVLPAAGMGAVTAQLAQRLPDGALRCNAQVTQITIRAGRAPGVTLADGATLDAESVVLAVPAPEAARLAGIDIPAAAKPVSVTCVYFATPTSLYSGPKIVLNAEPDAYVNNVTQLDNIAPTYAPAGQHLLSAVVLGIPDGNDTALANACRADLARMFPHAAFDAARLLRIYRIPLAQFDQPPGIFAQLPGNATPPPGLVIAGEYTESSSIHGAMHSGEKAAQLILGS
jgi:phytoene dehydrogenase-like protein